MLISRISIKKSLTWFPTVEKRASWASVGVSVGTSPGRLRPPPPAGPAPSPEACSAPPRLSRARLLPGNWQPRGLPPLLLASSRPPAVPNTDVISALFTF